MVRSRQWSIRPFHLPFVNGYRAMTGRFGDTRFLSNGSESCRLIAVVSHATGTSLNPFLIEVESLSGSRTSCRALKILTAARVAAVTEINGSASQPDASPNAMFQ